MAEQHTCPYCSKVCKTARGLTQHIQQTRECAEAQEREISIRRESQRIRRQLAIRQGIVEEPASPEPGQTRRSRRVLNSQLDVPETANFASGIDPAELPDQEHETIFPPPDDDEMTAMPSGVRKLATQSSNSSDSETTNNSDQNATTTVQVEPDTEMRANFKQYCEEHCSLFLPLTKEQVSGIRLMDVLR
jgi:hypothetical protein